MNTLDMHVIEFDILKSYPKELYYIGNKDLLLNKKISIVGSRRPISYTKQLTYELSSKLSLRGFTIVSGAAMGVDSISHNSSINYNTIAVMANSLDIRYPSVNSSLIKNIENNGLCLSAYEKNYKARAYDFVKRNELVVSLGEILIITQADLNSGSLHSYNFAKKLGKKIYVIPHRINDSLGTQNLIKNNLVEVIYNVDDFVNTFKKIDHINDEIINFCKNTVSLDVALKIYGNKIYEYELDGKLYINNLKVYVN